MKKYEEAAQGMVTSEESMRAATTARKSAQEGRNAASSVFSLLLLQDLDQQISAQRHQLAAGGG